MSDVLTTKKSNDVSDFIEISEVPESPSFSDHENFDHVDC